MENAQVVQPAGGSLIEIMAWLAIVFAAMYFLMIRPNKKRMDEYKKMLSELKVGSKIIFAGGIYGVVKAIESESLKVEIADGVVITVPKSAVANIV
jgi:preprotein translocase subunit YajC